LQTNNAEWTGTKMIFELTPHGNKTEIRFTHLGLIPELECYERVGQGWNTVIKDYLFNYLTEGRVAEQLL
jgi:hypothetical protein